MAPIDRTEHRQQRIRGAGIGSVQASFNFDLGAALKAKPAKQASLPPQSSQRFTPTRTTPRAVDNAAKRYRSASIQRSSATKARTPIQNVTPQLGKRKRGSSAAQLSQEGEGELDELSPEQNAEVQSVEKSRRAALAVSPVLGDLDDVPDELSFVEDVGSSAQKIGTDAVVDAFETPVPARKLQRSPIVAREKSINTPPVRSVSAGVKKSIARSAEISKPAESTPRVSMGPPTSQIRSSSVSAALGARTTPSLVHDNDAEVDELSTPQLSAASTRSRIVASQPSPADDGEVDELSPDLAKPTQLQAFIEQSPSHLPRRQPVKPKTQKAPPGQRPPNARVRSRRVVEEEEAEEEDVIQSSPAASKPRPVSAGRSKVRSTVVNDDGADELSPEVAKAKHIRARSNVRPRTSTDEAQGSDVESEAQEAIPQPVFRKPPPPKALSSQKPRSSQEQPPRKRQKRGPTLAIEVMRLKGFGLKGYTVVDTTRKAAQDWITARVRRMTEKIGAVAEKDKGRAKAIRQQRNLVLAYSEKLDDIFLDLQDANNSGLDNAGRLKQLRKQGKQLMAEYIQTQQERDQIALQNDDITESFLREKKQAEARQQLSESMFEIQAAIRKGKSRAQTEGRENEGPEIPLSMLLDDVARDVGAGGLLSSVSTFNGALERTAGLLEGRI